MNQAERKRAIKDNYNKYHPPGGSNFQTLKRNAIFISAANSLKHEMKKLEICYELKSIGIPFLTEAEKNKKKGDTIRRVDIVNLVTGEEIEIETNHKINKFKNKEGTTIYI